MLFRSNPEWDPSVRALVPFPELLQRMAGSPQWMLDLGNAAQSQPGEATQAVQLLRQRAYQAGYLRSNEQQLVQPYGQAILVQPVRPVFVSNVFFVSATRWHHRREWRPNGTPSPAAQMQANGPQIGQRGNGGPSPALQLQQLHHRVTAAPYVQVPEANRQPIIQSSPRPQLRSDSGRPAQARAPVQRLSAETRSTGRAR